MDRTENVAVVANRSASVFLLDLQHAQRFTGDDRSRKTLGCREVSFHRVDLGDPTITFICMLWPKAGIFMKLVMLLALEF